MSSSSCTGPGIRKRLATVAGAMLFTAGPLAPPSSAGIMQFAVADYDVGAAQVKRAVDSVSGIGTITRDILAEITSPTAIASVGRFGEVGMSASIFSGPTDGSAHVITHVNVQSDEFLNATPFTQRVTTSFVIDGGALKLLGSANSRLDFFMELDRGADQAFGAGVTLTSDAGGVPELTTSDSDIGATLDASKGIVTIPLSFQTADLGLLVPGAAMTLSYSADIFLQRGPGEGLEGNYSDPFRLSSHPVLGEVTFSPVSGSSVPEPSTLALFAIGLSTAGFGVMRRSRMRRSSVGR